MADPAQAHPDREAYIGMMSGTSMDAVDGALVQFDGDRPSTLAFASRHIPAALRHTLSELQTSGPDEIARSALAASALADLYADVALELLRIAPAGEGSSLPSARPARTTPIAIGAHGQTIRHRPELGYTVQLLNGARLAERTGLTVVCDFRSADVAAGGQGAPLVPAFHADAFGAAGTRRAIVNIGGIANLSVVEPGLPTLGYDTGPGNALLDDWCLQHQGTLYDRGGRWASQGTVHAALLASMLEEPYFARPAPKSTGRDLFNRSWLEALLSHGPASIRPVDVQATLAELTAATIALACNRSGADQIYVCGGGAMNGDLMQRITRSCSPAVVATTDALGAPPQAVEAVAFAWLARRRIRLESGNLPAVTGARGPRVLGAVYPAPAAGSI